MTDLDLHADLLLVTGVERVFPPRHSPATLLRAAAGVTEIGIGVSDVRPIPVTALAALTELRGALPPEARVRLRIASVA